MAFKAETWIILSTPHSLAIRAIFLGPENIILYALDILNIQQQLKQLAFDIDIIK
jgi:hypothetical protein